MILRKFEGNRFRIDGEIAENHAILPFLVNLTGGEYNHNVMVGDNATTCVKLHQIVCEAHNNSIFRQQSVIVMHTQQFSDDFSTHYCA